MLAYFTDIQTGVLVSQLTMPDGTILPDHAVTVDPPAHDTETQAVRWDGVRWGVIPIEQSPYHRRLRQEAITALDWSALAAYPFVEVAAGVRAELKSRINARRDSLRVAGVEYDFGDLECYTDDGETEVAGVRNLDTGPADQLSWLSVMASAQLMVSQGRGGEALEPLPRIRTADNREVPVTAQRALDCMNYVLDQLAQVTGESWELKKQVTLSDSLESLQEVDLEV